MMHRHPLVTEVEIDLRSNKLLLFLDQEPERIALRSGAYAATIDVGTRGRLIGVEIGEWYLQIAEDDSRAGGQVRSVDVDVWLRPDGRVELGRRGPGYEISFPSGNQCWRGANGMARCSRVID
jgi:hypothetical protein